MARDIPWEFQEAAELLQSSHGNFQRLRRGAAGGGAGSHRLECREGRGRLVPGGGIGLCDHPLGDRACRHVRQRWMHVGPRGVDRVEAGQDRRGVGPLVPVVFRVAAKGLELRRRIGRHHEIEQRPLQRLQPR